MTTTTWNDFACDDLYLWHVVLRKYLSPSLGCSVGTKHEKIWLGMHVWFLGGQSLWTTCKQCGIVFEGSMGSDLWLVKLYVYIYIYIFPPMKTYVKNNTCNLVFQYVTHTMHLLKDYTCNIEDNLLPCALNMFYVLGAWTQTLTWIHCFAQRHAAAAELQSVHGQCWFQCHQKGSQGSARGSRGV